MLNASLNKTFACFQMKDSDRGIHMLYPLMYVHSLYSNMIDKAYQHMSVRWSFYMAAGDGKLVVIKSQPQVLTEFMDEQDVDGKRFRFHLYSYKQFCSISLKL